MRNMILAAGTASLTLFAGFASAATVLDLTGGNGGAPVSFGGALWETAELVDEPTGTGVFKPFLRVDRSGNETNEEGYNTDRKNADQQFDEKAGKWTRSLLLANLEAVDNLFRFALDLGENNSGEIDPKLSLQDFMLFTSDNKLDDPLITFNPGTNVWSTPGITLRYDLDAGEDRRVDLNYNVVGKGNGRQDLFISVDASLFNTTDKYLILYSKLGADNCTKRQGQTSCTDGFAAEGTFEEFSVREGEAPAPVPLPAAAWLMLAGLGGLGALKLRKKA